MKENQDIFLERSIFPRVCESDAIYDVLDTLEPDYFSQPQLREAWKACLHLVQSGQIVNPITVSRQLRNMQSRLKAEDVAELFAPVKSSVPVTTIADSIKELWELRRLDRIGRELITQSRTDLLDFAMDEILGIAMSRTSRNVLGISELTGQVREELHARIEAHNHNKPIPGFVQTGIRELDNMKVMRTGRMVIVAGRPAMGKSSLAKTITMNMAPVAPVFFNSLEEANLTITEQLACIHAEVNGRDVEGGSIQEWDLERFEKSLNYIHGLPITISEERKLTSILTALKKWRMQTDQTKPAAAVIDYLQLVKSSGATREREIANISMALTEAAVSMDILLIAVAQLSRAVETRGGDKRPQMSDLRESGQLEQDAHAVLFVYRPEYYGFDTDDEGNGTEGMAEIIVEKNRRGPVGIIKAQFIKPYAKFTNWEMTPLSEVNPVPDIALPQNGNWEL